MCNRRSIVDHLNLTGSTLVANNNTHAYILYITCIYFLIYVIVHQFLYKMISRVVCNASEKGNLHLNHF